MKRFITTVYGITLLGFSSMASVLTSCTSSPAPPKQEEGLQEENAKALAQQDLERAIALVDLTLEHYVDPETSDMRRFYNPFTKTKSDERASVWMYTAGIEAVNAILSGLEKAKDKGETKLYQAHHDRYINLLDKLYSNVDYYLGSFDLVSYTQTKSWSVYAVNRAGEKGQANVTGVLNVYDDQMWLIRELLESYRLTGKEAYLEKAEYLTAYVLDGWDTTLDEQGNEHGGITWGPGYTTKHACSNGPLISPLVWLHELYKGKSDKIEHRYIDKSDRQNRRTKDVEKQQYYLDYAKAIYNWQKSHLLNAEGVYADMMGGCVPDCEVRYEEIDGQRYRANTPLTEAVGEALTYNSGTMLSGAVDLYRATGTESYAEDGRKLAKNSFDQFATLGQDVPQYYSFGSDGFKNWFNGVLMRSYQEAAASIAPRAKDYLHVFQQNLDFGYDHYNQDGFLPTNLLKGWEGEKDGQGVEAMFMFTYAAQYAILGQQQLLAD